MNPLPAARLPEASEHDAEVKRFPGTDVIWQVVPSKPDPEAVTGVPGGPATGVKVKVAAPGTVNGALPVSPVVPVTCTLNKVATVIPVATVNIPCIAPLATVHVGLEIRPLGDDEIVQPVSFVLKFVPVTKTVIPARPEPGKTESPGVSTKLAVPLSRPGDPRRARE